MQLNTEHPTVILLGLSLTIEEEEEEDDTQEVEREKKKNRRKKAKAIEKTRKILSEDKELRELGLISMEVGLKMADILGGADRDLNLKETELCLGLPGIPKTSTGNKRGFSETVDLKLNFQSKDAVDLNENIKNSSSKEKNNLLPSCTKDPAKPPAKAQVVGWPPVRSYRKNIMAQKNPSEDGEKAAAAAGVGGAAFVKVCMDGAPYLRKVDLKMYKSYRELSDALAKMFSSFTMGNFGAQGMIDFMNESKLMDLLNSSEYVPTYEDKDGDWMLVGDVPWEMFVDSCKRLRLMKGSEAIGLAPRAMEKCKSRT